MHPISTVDAILDVWVQLMSSLSSLVWIQKSKGLHRNASLSVLKHFMDVWLAASRNMCMLGARTNNLFSCDQAALWMFFLSVCPSVCLSVCPSVTPFWLCSHAKGQGQRSKVKVTEVTTQLNRFRTLTPVWIHTWWWNDTYSLMLLRRGVLLFFKVIRQISRSHSAKNCQIDPDWAFPDCNSSLNSPMGTKCCTKLEVA